MIEKECLLTYYKTDISSTSSASALTGFTSKHNTESINTTNIPIGQD